MASSLKNLSSYNPNEVPNGIGMRIGIVVAEWNFAITNSLRKAACDTLMQHGVNEADILVSYVPGTFELSLGAQHLIESHPVDAVITLGCVIQGETRHFDFICQSVTDGVTRLNLKYSLPVVFGVLTTENEEQALDRAGGKHGNKGVEAAITALKMIKLMRTNQA